MILNCKNILWMLVHMQCIARVVHYRHIRHLTFFESLNWQTILHIFIKKLYSFNFLVVAPFIGKFNCWKIWNAKLFYMFSKRKVYTQKVNTFCKIKRKQKLYVQINFPGSQRKSFVLHMTFLYFMLNSYAQYFAKNKFLENLKWQTILHVFKKVYTWKVNTYRLITMYLLLQVNCDKIMHTRWNFDASSARTWRVNALDKHQNWSASALYCHNSRA